MSETKKKTTWEVLSAIDCNKHTKTKNNLTYLSWAWAWGITKANFADANYRVVNFDGKPYLFDADLGYLIQTEVTIAGETIPMHLFVMDGANNAQKNKRYSYEVIEWKNRVKTGNMIEKFVEPATMFDINTTIMRCLTKNLAMFGLGHYIYAGEDLPADFTEQKPLDEEALKVAIIEMLATKDKKTMTDCWHKYPSLQTDDKFVKACMDVQASWIIDKEVKK